MCMDLYERGVWIVDKRSDDWYLVWHLLLFVRLSVLRLSLSRRAINMQNHE